MYPCYSADIISASSTHQISSDKAEFETTTLIHTSQPGLPWPHPLYETHTVSETKTQKHAYSSTVWQLVLFPVITATLHLYARPSLSTGHIKKAHRPPTRCQPAALTGYLLCNMTTSQTTLRNISRARVHLTSAHNDLQDTPKGHKHDLFTLMYFAHGVLRNTLLEMRSFSVHSMVTGSHICHV